MLLRAAALVAALLVTACGSAEVDRPALPAPDAAPGDGPVVSGEIATDLTAPWSMAPMPDDSVLLTHRDSAEVTRIGPSGGRRTVARIEGVVPGGEGGLLGVAVAPGKTENLAVYVYYTAAADNRVARLRWDGRQLLGQRAVLTGIPKSQIHNGGRIAFGPDGYLYVATGDAGRGELAQDQRSLGGKILRVTASGDPAPGNPDPDSAVYSVGHRNVQGLAWDGDGRLWASEFGQSDADELNLIVPGGNYGWPECEGPCDVPDRVNPAVVWSPTSIASPSGMAIADGSAWVASLRGEVLWEVPLVGGDAGEPIAWFADEYGRLRDIIVGPDGDLWLATNNTDGRGDPAPGDDRILRITP